MLLTVSKRLEFSASRRLFVPDWSDQENLIAFGPETRAGYGTGRNYIAYFVFTGPVNPTTGMLINISKIKERAGEVVAKKFDHKFLNEQNPAFNPAAAGPPTPENIARQLYLDVAPLFSDVEAHLCACHLSETSQRSATFYADGACDSNYGFDFSAARRTMSPHLSEEENRQAFGDAISPHGHNYRARVAFRADKFSGESPLVRHHEIESTLQSLRSELDHRFLNEVRALKDRPMTTESLAGYLFERVNANVPSLHRIRLHERDDFLAEFWKDKNVFLGLGMGFEAAHRLYAAGLSETENAQLYGKCNNPLGHGHSYFTETTVGGEYDARTGTLFDFLKLRSAIAASLEPWQDRHLDLETEDFRESPSTGENIVRALWPKIDNRVGQRLVRLRLWETPNNRFTLRRML
jgi:6-pyruvoyltetrahydropterin/6-carboxytetrahydropterin synthase